MRLIITFVLAALAGCMHINRPGLGYFGPATAAQVTAQTNAETLATAEDNGDCASTSEDWTGSNAAGVGQCYGSVNGGGSSSLNRSAAQARLDNPEFGPVDEIETGDDEAKRRAAAAALKKKQLELRQKEADLAADAAAIEEYKRTQAAKAAEEEKP